MGVCRIAVCHDCGCYVDLDKIGCCWENNFWWHETWDTLSEEHQSLREDQLIYELIYTQALCRFYNLHWGHNIEIFSDGAETAESYFNVLYIGGNCDNEKALREVTIGELYTEMSK